VKFSLLIFLILTLSSCSSVKFETNVNCSPRALEYLQSDIKKKNDSNVTEALNSQNIIHSLELMKYISSTVLNCYQTLVNEGHSDEYHVCAVVSINDKRKISFIDVDDHNAELNPDLKKCIMKTIETSDTSKIQSATLVQPINLYARRH
jgi:hypothetical protein